MREVFLVIDTLEKARAFFENDRFAVENGIVIDSIENGRAVVSLTPTPHHKNAAGGVMGGAIFTMCDFSFAVCSNCFADGYICVTADSNISFISGCKGDKLICTAKCVKSGRSLAFYECEVVDNLGNLVARATSSMFKKNLNGK